MKHLYICNSYYHILVATIKALKNKGINSDLLLTDDNCNMKYDDIKEKIEKSHIFENVYIEYFPKQLKNCNQNVFGLIKKHLFLSFRKMPKKYIDKNYSKIYLFNDTCIFGRLINKQRIKYILLEDGTDSFKKNREYMMSHNKKKHFLKKILNINELGESDNIEYVEVNNKEGVNLNQMLVECPKDKMFNDLSLDDINILQRIFLNNLDINKINNKTLIITQPLFEDGFLSSREEQIKIYKLIVKENGLKNNQIVFKTHPRETTKYNDYFTDSVIISDNFPIEMLNFFPNLHFDNIITISSTAIEIFNNCNKKITLGWEWLEEKKKVG